VRESRGSIQTPGRALNLNRAQTRQLRDEERRLVRQLQGQHRQHLRDLQAQGQRPDRSTLRQLRAQNQQQLRDLRTQLHERRLGLHGLPPQGRELRPGGRPRVTPQFAREGRFGARFGQRADRGEWGAERTAPRLAWRRHHRAGFVAWGGSMFWPHVYTDVFYYTFWPEAYDNGYWAYAYDDFFNSIYWATGNPYLEYAYAGPTAESVGVTPGPARKSRQVNRVAPDSCEPDNAITNWPFGQIERAVQATTQQQALLDELKSAAAQAANNFKAACPRTSALTPTGRLQAMVDRLQVSLDAVHTVRPPLMTFYDSLTDEQKARFNAIRPDVGQKVRTTRNESEDANACAGQKPGLADLPIERIEDAVRPTDAQQAALDQLSKANEKALAILQAACPNNIPQTPVGRLDAIEKRLDAMIQAAKTVQPALQEFYSSLANEQKAAFNTLDQQARR
jgi:hypothetical protein